MKKILVATFASALAFLAFAEDAAKKAPPAPAAKETSTAPVLLASAATITKPFVLKDGAISQPDQTEVSKGGKAVFTFTVPKDGNYIIHAVANATSDDSNSFYLNIDGPVED